MLGIIIIVVCGGLVAIRLFLNKLYGSIDPNNEVSAKGKIVVITGANAGVGRYSCLEFAKRDAHIVLACRDLSRANEAIKWIKGQTTRGQMVNKYLIYTYIYTDNRHVNR